MSFAMQRGFTMIEVLVSVFVLAIGVLGAAGMQLTALRTTQQAAFQTTALQLAAELADKMRANDQSMKQGVGSNPFADIDYSTAEEPQAPTVLCYGKSANCDAETLAGFDIYEWQRRMKTALPPARVVVCRDSSPWDAGAGAYKWACNGASKAGATLVIKIGWQGKNPDGSLIRDANKQFPPSLALSVVPYVK